MSFYHALADPVTKQAAPQQRGYFQRNLLDPMWNAASSGLGRIGRDARSGVTSLAQSAATGVANTGRQLYTGAANAVDQGIDSGLGAIDRGITQPAANLGRKIYAGAANAVDQGIDSGLGFVDRNISQPIAGAAHSWLAASQGPGSPYQVAQQPQSPSGPMTAPQPTAPVATPGPSPMGAQSFAAPQPSSPSSYQALGQPPAPQQGPDMNALFQNTHGTPFNPVSRHDNEKMEQMRQFMQSNPQAASWTPNTFSRNFYRR